MEALLQPGTLARWRGTENTIRIDVYCQNTAYGPVCSGWIVTGPHAGTQVPCILASSLDPLPNTTGNADAVSA